MSEKNRQVNPSAELPEEIRATIEAAREKKAEDIVVLDMRGLSSFTDFFVIMQGNSSKQNQAVCDAVELDLKKSEVRPLSVEGREHAEWILMDYGDFIVHIFSARARSYYQLEKLWGDSRLHTF
jgi:ribosome-associated protein